jgi:hypothetical protein
MTVDTSFRAAFACDKPPRRSMILPPRQGMPLGLRHLPGKKWNLVAKTVALIEPRFAIAKRGQPRYAGRTGNVAIVYSWGTWEERWPKGRFSCVFVEAQPGPNGMIRAAGLYRAVDGDMFDDIATFEERISDRTAVVGDGGGVLVRKEFAELLAIMPAFLQEVSERFDDIPMAPPQNSRLSRQPREVQIIPRNEIGVSILNAGREA